MCGIVGLVVKNNSGLYKKHQDCFHQLLQVGVVRGEDATGLIAVDRDGSFHIMKEAFDSSVFIPQWLGSQCQRDMYQSGKAYIGHNRKKTVGKIDDASAHPFVVENDFAMVHNGTLHNHEKLAKDVSVDSHALTIHLRKAYRVENEIRKSLEDAYSEVNGAYAVAGYDQQRNLIFLSRNDERPLSIIETDDAWYWASENLMLDWILARNGYLSKDRKYVPINAHDVITFDLNKSKMYRDELKVKKATVTTPVLSIGGVAATTGKAGTTIGAANRECSDQELKFLRKKLLGKRISFHANDFIEEDFPLTLEKGAKELILFGSNDQEIKYIHSIHMYLNIDSIDLEDKTSPEVLLKQTWSCVVNEIIRQNNGYLTIIADSAKLVKPSLDFKAIEEARAYRTGLRHKFKSELEAEKVRIANASKSEQWKGGAIHAELLFRNQFKTIEDAVRKAKNDGIELTGTLTKGRFLYTDADGGIYYESAVNLH